MERLLKTYTNSELREMYMAKKKEEDTRIIKALVKEIHGDVIDAAMRGERHFLSRKYTTITKFHIVEACKALQELFPEAEIKTEDDIRILVEWN